MWASRLMFFTSNELSATMSIEKIKILSAVLELTARQLTPVPIQPVYLKNGPNGLNWQCCLAGSSKAAPRIFIFIQLPFIMCEIHCCYAPTVLGYNNSVLAIVYFGQGFLKVTGFVFDNSNRNYILNCNKDYDYNFFVYIFF